MKAPRGEMRTRRTAERLAPYTVARWHMALVVLLGVAACDASVSRARDDMRRTERDERHTIGAGDTTAAARAVRDWGTPAPWRVHTSPALHIGESRGDSLYEFSRIVGGVLLLNGDIAVADGSSGQIRIYSRSGRFLSASGRRGGGPGEFEDLAWLGRCHSNELVAYDRRRAVLSVFDQQGRFLRRTPLRSEDGQRNPQRVMCGPPGYVLVALWPRSLPSQLGPYRPSWSVHLVPLEGTNPWRAVGSFPASERYRLRSGTRPRPLGTETLIAADTQRIFVATGDRYEVEVYSTAGERTGTVRVDRPQRRLSTEARDAFIASQTRNIPNPSVRATVERTLRDYQYPEYLPPYGALHIDELQYIWLGDYEPSGASITRWTVFAPGGGVIGRVTTPPSVEILSIHATSLLGRYQDDNGVEYVRVYRIDRGD